MLNDFHLGAEVVSRDGRRIGSLARVIVDEEGYDPRAIVVHEDGRFAGHLLAPGSWFLADELLVPIKSVVRAGSERVELELDAADVRRLPPYLSYHYRPLTRADAAARALALATSTVAAPAVTETANKSATELEIDAGENVMLGRTGRVLGHVRDVLVDDGELVGIVMHPTGFFEHDVVLPVRFLDRSDDLALFADLQPEDLEKLKPFQRTG
ncbi:MAG TPA: PRC-barrel domain-containing protein [Candidatus Dormibacteraeota bacterium]